MIRRYLISHARNCLASLGYLSRHRLATGLTVAVVGIALALPAALQILIRSGTDLAGNWESVRDFSVYMVPGTPLERATQLADELGARDGIDTVTLVPADAALAEFRRDPAQEIILGVLPENPLPHALVVRPDTGAAPATLEALAAELAALDSVELVKLDTEWLERLNGIVELLRRLVWMTGILLVVAVITIIGNTIRLDIQTRRDEIEVAKLLGASDGFVRRPFLYTGFWYGLMGGALALVLVGTGLLLMGGPVARLAELYGARFSLRGIDPALAGAVLGGGLVAGLGGAWTAVARHLSAIQPRV